MLHSRRAMLAGAIGAGFATAGRGASLATIRLTAGQLVQGGWALGASASEVGAVVLDGAPVPRAPDGAFFLAFDRDAPPAARLSVRLANGLGLDQTLTIARRDWPVERIDAPFYPPAMPDAEFARRRAIELAQITAARAHDTGATGWRQGFHWPVRGRISGQFGAQRVYRGAAGGDAPGAYHPGIDIAAPAGTPYVAPADGVVVLAAAAPFTLEGNLLIVDHGMGLNSAFLHSAGLLVAEGRRVARGEPLGLVGMTGRATGPHLHWAVRWRVARLDPLLLAGPMG